MKKIIIFIKKHFVVFFIPVFVISLYIINLSSYLPNVYVNDENTKLYTKEIILSHYKEISNIYEITNQEDFDKILNNNFISVVIGYLPNNEKSEKTLELLEKESKDFDINFYILNLSNKNINTSLGKVGAPSISGIFNEEISFEEVAPIDSASLKEFTKNYSLINPSSESNTIFTSDYLNSQKNLKNLIIIKMILILLILYFIYFLYLKTRNKKIKYILLIFLLIPIFIYNYNTNDYFYNNKNSSINLEDVPDDDLKLSNELKNIKINTDYLKENNIDYYIDYFNLNNEPSVNKTNKGFKIIIPNIIENNLDIDVVFENIQTTGEGVLYYNIKSLDDIFDNLKEMMNSYEFIKYEENTLDTINGFTIKEYRGWTSTSPYWTYRYITAIKFDSNTGEIIQINMAPNNYSFEVPDKDYKEAMQIYLNMIKNSEF